MTEAPEGSSRAGHHGAWGIALGAAAVPPILVLRVLDRLAVNVPYWDQWRFVPLLTAAQSGSFPLFRLWEQHNEHRVPLPRLVLLALASLTGWNLRAELLAAAFVNLGTVTLLVVLLVRTVGSVAGAATPWLAALASLLLFTLGQWENWASGWQVQIFLAGLATVTSVLLLADWRGRWGRLLLALASAIGASLSFASGLAIPPLVAAAVWMMPGPVPPRRRLAQSTFAAAVTIALVGLYLIGYQRPSHHPSPWQFLQDPRSFIDYVVVYLGAGAGAIDITQGRRWGWAGIGALIVSVVSACAHSPAHRRAAAPWLLLAAAAIGGGAITGVGRLGFGVMQAVAPRYVAVSATFWVATAALVTIAASDWLSVVGRERARLAAAVVAGSVATLWARQYVGAWTEGYARFAERSAQLERGRECVQRYAIAPDTCLALVWPEPASVRVWAASLERLRLGPFGEPPEPPLESYAIAPTAARGFIDGVAVEPTGDVRITGWARDPETRRPARGVLVSMDGAVLGRAQVGLPRPDVARAVSRRLRYAGWSIRVGAFRVSPGVHDVKAYVLLDAHHLASLPEGHTLEMP